MSSTGGLPPGREPLRSDWFIQQLGNSNQKVMGLSVENRQLRERVKALEALLDARGIKKPDA